MAGFPKGKNKLAEVAKRPRPGCPLDKEAISKLIDKHTGNISRVADSLGTSRGAIRGFIDRDTELQDQLKQARERWIDDIEESVLSRAAQSNDTALQCFVLKTQARQRGWDQDESKNAAKDIATAAFDFIISKQKQSEQAPQ